MGERGGPQCFFGVEDRPFSLIRCCPLRSALSERPTGLDEPGLIGQHDRLDPVTEIELLQDVSDVRLRSVLADDEFRGDLLIRETSGDESEYLSLPRVSSLRSDWTSLGEALRVNSSMRRRVTDGRTWRRRQRRRGLWDQLVLGASLSRKPLALARSASYTYSSRSNVVEPLQDNRLARPGNFSGRRPSNKA